MSLNFGFVTLFPVTEWVIRLAMVAAVPLRRTPQAARSWLLLIFFLPIPGLILYSVIGRPRFPAWRAARFARLSGFFSNTAARLSATVTPILPGSSAFPAPQSVAMAGLAKQLGGFPATGGNAVELFTDYDPTIDRIVADIDAAQRHVRVMVYIFSDDATGAKVVDALQRAVARGVKCHVLFDPVGSRVWLRGIRAKLVATGAEVRESLPIRLVHSGTRRDMRNHRKLFLIDDDIGFIGSQNIVDKSFRPGVSNEEMVVRITGPAVAAMQAIFLADWFMETEEMIETEVLVAEPAGTMSVQLLPSGASYRLEGFETLLIWAIHNARERVIITTPYLIPDEVLLNAMHTAVLRGVRVDLIVSLIVDQWFVRLAQRSYYEELLHNGINIYRYAGYLLHAKNVSIDSEFAIVGSSNVDARSFTLNEEVNAILSDGKIVADVEAVQIRALGKGGKLDLAEWRQRSFGARVAEGIARMVSPLL
jgi:cardiolipin synthase